MFFKIKPVGMKKFIIALFVACSTSLVSAQIEQKYSAVNEPSWVQLMYSANAELGAVVKAYETYYAEHDLVKNVHTQYYKRWVREVQRQNWSANQSNSGNEYIEQNEASYLQNSFSLRDQKSPTSPWQCIGPWDFDKEAASRSYAAGAAHVYTVKRSTTDTTVLYAGTATAGLWKTTDSGQNWNLLTRDMMVTHIFAIEIDFSNEDVVYFVSNGDLYKTTDGGVAWQEVGDIAFQALNHKCKDIVMSPVDNQILYLTSDKGFFRTTDGGDNWTLINSSEHQEIEIHPTNSDILYTIRVVGNQTEFHKSIDGGLSFIQQTSGWPLPVSSDEQLRTEIAVSPAAPNYVYALCTGSANGGSGLYGIYVSTDQGQNWSFRCCGSQPAGPPSLTNINMMGWDKEGEDDGGQYYYDVALDVDPDDSSKIHVGGVNHWVSTDGGYTFTCPVKWSESGEAGYVHADIHDIRFLGSELWIACDGGVFHSSDKGTTINRKMFGIEGSDFWGFGTSYQGGNVMLGGAYHNGTLLKDKNVYTNDWICTGGGDGVRGFVNQGDDNRVVDDYEGRILSGDRTIANGTFQFDSLPNSSYIVGNSSNFALDPRCYNHIFFGRNKNLLKSTDYGVTYSVVHQFDDEVMKVQVAWTNPDVMYVATYSDWWGDKKVWRTDNGGNSWVEITPSSAEFGGNIWIPLDIAVSSNDENIIWLARTSYYGGGTDTDGQMVYKSIDGGANWTNITTGTLDGEGITNIVHQRGTDGGVYIGTRRAVYYINNSLSDWQLFNVDLPVDCHSTKLIPNYDSEKLRNATSRSVYEVEFYESSLPQAQISANKLTANCFDNTIQFFDYSVISDQNPTWNWTFQGGVPSSSTDRNPLVSYSTPGEYNVELTIADDYGTSTQSYIAFVSYIDPIVNFDLSEDFESGFNVDWRLQNDSNTFNWGVTSVNYGPDCVPSFVSTVNHYDINQVGDEAQLITPYIDLNNVTDAMLYYDYAYAKYNNSYADGFRIDVSTDCGDNWTELYEAFGSDLETVPEQGSWWEPTDCADWSLDNEINLSNYDGLEIMLRFVAINDFGNNFYLDNINIEANSLVMNEDHNQPKFSLFPNPTSGDIQLSYNTVTPALLQVFSVEGKLVYESSIAGNNQVISLPLSSGIYEVQLVAGELTNSIKLVVTR